MPFKKGESGNPNGREKGSQNKVSKQFKELLIETYQALEEGKGTGLATWAKKNPTDFYRICAKLIPQQIGGDPENPLEVQFYIMPDGTKLEFR